MTSYARGGDDWMFTEPVTPVTWLIDLGVDSPAYRAQITEYESECAGLGNMVDRLVKDEIEHRAWIAERRDSHARWMRRATAYWVIASWTLGILLAVVATLWWVAQ